MATNAGSELENKPSVIADLTALFCRGGLVVESLGESGTISVRSTIQPDGDVTISLARPTLDQASDLMSHLIELETRIHKVARLVKRTVWIVHGSIGVAIWGGWFAFLNASFTAEDSLTPMAVWIVFSLSSGAAIKYLLGTSFFQKLLASIAVTGLSRFAVS